MPGFLDAGGAGTMLRTMDFEPHLAPLNDRIGHFWHRGVRLARRLAIAFGLATFTAIFVGVAVTDNAFVQILVTVLAGMALWLPFAMLIARIERFLDRRRLKRSERAAVRAETGSAGRDHWGRLLAVAPSKSQRIAAIRRSLESSRLELGRAALDPDSHDLCLLIDRRLPELIERELDGLPPDDRNRQRQLDELVTLVERFARHCSRKRSGDPGGADFEAAVLRRRFEARLSEL